MKKYEYDNLDRKLLDKIGRLIKYEDDKAYINEEDISYLYTDIGLFCQILEVLDRNNIIIKRKPMSTKYLKQLIYNYRENHDIKIKEQIVEICMRYIYTYIGYCAKYFDISYDETISYAYEAVEDIIKNYDGGSSIEQYLGMYIRNYVLKSIRDSSPIKNLFYNVSYFDIVREIKALEQKYNTSVLEDPFLIEEVFTNIKEKYNLTNKQIEMMKRRYYILNPIYKEDISINNDNFNYDAIIIIHEMLSLLDEKDRELFELKYNNICSLSEIARRQKISKQTLSLREQTIIDKMNNYLIKNRELRVKKRRV